MFGRKLNEFDNSTGKLKDFNKIFPLTKLDGNKNHNVEIGDIVFDEKKRFVSSVFVRHVTVFKDNGEVIEEFNHDFGENNFFENEDWQLADKVRFKYFAHDLDGNLIAKGYSFDEIAQKLNCDVTLVKKRLNNKIDKNSNTYKKFNICRREL